MSRRAGTIIWGAMVLGLGLLWAQPAEAQAQAPGKSLDRGVKFYGQKQYLSATVMLHKVLTSKAATLAQKQRAEFLMGKALYHKRLYAASLIYFDKVVDAGSAHKHFKDTLLWLAALQTKLSVSSGILDRIGKYPLSAFNAPALRSVRNQLLYLLGRFYSRQGDKASLDKAIQLFKMVR
jgi:hypothetical protein